MKAPYANHIARISVASCGVISLEINGKSSYYSRYQEVFKLTSTTSDHIVATLKSTFARHGIPEVLRSDNGPQCVNEAVKPRTKSYGFHLITSSLGYTQSN